MLLTLLLIVSLIVFVYFYFRKHSNRPFNYPPGPKWFPLFGNMFLLKKLTKRYGGQHMALLKLAEQYNTNVLGLKLGEEFTVAVFSYEMVKKVFTQEEFQGRSDNFFTRLRSMGTKKGITLTDGEHWRIHRSFVLSHLRNLGYGKKTMENFMKEEISVMFEILDKTGDKVKISSLFAPAVINILWAFVCGARFSRSDKRLIDMLELLDERSKKFDMSGGILNQVPCIRYIAPEWCGYNLLMQFNKEIRNLLMEPISQHINSWTEANCNEDLLYLFITEMKKADERATSFTLDQMIMMCLDIFVGGSQTTSHVLDFLFLIMILHPDIQEKVYNCVNREFGAQEIQYAHRIRVPYVEAVLLEVHRYFPVIPLTAPRRVLTSTVLDGYLIPKNTSVLISIHSINIDKKYWKDPEIFRPERFLDSNGNLVLHDKSIPFGLGKRRCLGEVLANNCTFLFFVEIIRKYEVRLSKDSKKPLGIPQPGIMLTTEDYVAQFIQRQK